MGELSSKFTREDIETLIEALGDWELIGSQDYNFMQAVEDSPLPPEDHEAYEIFVRIKEHYRERKRQILEHRANRQEKAVFLKAKLMLVRKDMQINSLFEMEEEPSTPVPVLPTPEVAEPVAPVIPDDPNASEKLAMAEFFIKDLGVWGHYEKFLADQKEKG